MKTSEGFTLAPFASWEEALAHAKDRGVIWWQAPLAHEPHSCACKLTPDGKGIRMLPAPRLETDPFTLREDALPRLYRSEKEPMTTAKTTAAKFRLYGFEATSGTRYDVLGGAVERENANVMSVVPLDGEPAISKLAIGEETWCRALTEDVSKLGEAKRNKGKTPIADRFVVVRVE